MTRRTYRRTYGEVFSKFLIEVVAKSTSNPKLGLLLWDGAQLHRASSIGLAAAPYSDFQAATLYPPALELTVRKAIRFPTHAVPYGTTRELFRSIYEVLKQYTDLPENLLHLAAHSVFASWFVDAIATPVCLSLVSAPSGQGSRLLRLLACLYRHPLLLGQATLGGLCSLPLELQPALFLDAGQAKGPMEKLLRLLSAHDAYVPWKGQLIRFSGAKVVYNEESLPGNLLGAGFTEIRVPPPRRPLPIFDQRTQQRIVDEFQPKLLMYRLANYHQVAASPFDVPDSPVRDLARSLAASVPDEPALQSAILPLLQAQPDQVLVKPTSDLDSIVIEAMLVLCHEKERQSFHVAEVADNVNKILEARGEPLDMNAWAVGRKLRKLDITTRKLDAAGRGALLMNELRQHVHSLAWDRKMLVSHGDPQHCAECKRFRERDEEAPGLDQLAPIDEMS